jgi:BirA family transcriptional regulator, biotin operon repressor / biotin---[acetyl-CoA-carboxylase] ligase
MIIGSKKIFVDKLSSTNDHASFLLRKGKVQEGSVIHASYQTAGRGQVGNSWESQYAKNLLFSVILYPKSVKADQQFIISKLISLGIKDFLEPIVKEVHIKWPNDILVRNDKIAGILIENALIKNEIEHTIAGIGININQERFHSDAPNPVSLKILTKKEFDLETSLAGVLKCLDLRYKQLLYEKKPFIDSDYLSSLYRIDEWNEFQDNRGIFEGRIVNVTGTGRLQIEDRRSRVYEYGFKEVDFL